MLLFGDYMSRKNILGIGMLWWDSMICMRVYKEYCRNFILFAKMD